MEHLIRYANGKSFLLDIFHSSDTGNDILWSLPSPSELVDGGFTHPPPKMADYLMVTEKQEDPWFQLSKDTMCFTVNNSSISISSLTKHLRDVE